MNNLAIIPARGGSKRIPKKNIKDFLGKPIIAYSIETALSSGLFKEVMVSTDDEEIAKIAIAYGAKIPFLRSKENANDFATLNDVFLEVKEWYLNQNMTFDSYCILLPTSPLLTVKLLKEGYHFLQKTDFDSVRPVVQFNYPVQRAQKLSDGKIEFMYPEHEKTRSQDLEPAYHDAGMFYFIKNECDMTKNRGAFEINSIFAQDIDDETDWKKAEFKFNYISNK